MTTITIYWNRDKEYIGFDSMGHAEYAEEGEDIVCAGISALVQNSVNSIESFTEDMFDISTNEEIGLISFRFRDIPSHDSDLLIKSMVLGLQGIQKFYGNEYISLIFKEV